MVVVVADPERSRKRQAADSACIEEIGIFTLEIIVCVRRMDIEILVCGFAFTKVQIP